jgi:hypothetical protein
MLKLWRNACDWCWFNLIIRRNEFHPRLNMNIKRILKGKTTWREEMKRIMPLRQRAHDLDMRFN